VNSFKKKREAAGLTQMKSARELNISQSTISMWEIGASLPRVEQLTKIATLYNCTVNDLLQDMTPVARNNGGSKKIVIEPQIDPQTSFFDKPDS